MIDVTATALALRQNRRNTLSQMANPRSRRSLLFGAAALAVLGGGWFVVHHMASADATPVAAAVQAAPVNTVTLEPQKAQIWSEFSGRLDPVDYAEVRPQVSGRITEIRFKDGQTVKAGDVLFVIDPRPYQAAAAKAAADLRSAQTNAALAKANLARAESLRKAGAIALQSYDQAANASAVANAAIGAAQATLTQAQLDVGYAYVKAPISGKVSRAEITVGNLVQNQPSAPLLTSIVSKDGIYADFEVDEQTYVRGIHSAADTQSEQQKIPVELTLPGDSGHVYKGFIESFDNHIDTGSGTIRARARTRHVRVGPHRKCIRQCGAAGAGTRHWHRPEQKVRIRGRQCRQGGFPRSHAWRDGWRKSRRDFGPVARRQGDRRRHPAYPAGRARGRHGDFEQGGGAIGRPLLSNVPRGKP